VIVEAKRDRRAERRESTTSEILAAAWELAATQGLAGLSLRELAQKIGMRPPSLYWYFDSKNAIYDAMFLQGNRQLLARMAEVDWPSDAKSILRVCARGFVEFCVEDAPRFQLLFQRTIPGFVPSPGAYALAVEVVEQMRARLAAAGLRDPAAFDMLTALVSGIAAQQIANEPGGDRWVRLIDDMIDLCADHFLSQQKNKENR
jgi:AcrR family transcriptional regulator